MIVEAQGHDGTDAQKIKTDSDGHIQADILSGAGLAAQGYVYNGTSWVKLQRPDTFKTVASGVVANNASATIWTPAAGKTINLMGITVSRPTAGTTKTVSNFQITDNGTVFIDFGVWINAFTLEFSNGGYKLSAADNTLSLKNVAGGGETLCVTAWGYET